MPGELDPAYLFLGTPQQTCDSAATSLAIDDDDKVHNTLYSEKGKRVLTRSFEASGKEPLVVVSEAVSVPIRAVCS